VPLTGVEAAVEFKRIRADLPVVLVSGHLSDEVRREAAQAGVDRALLKPNTVEELGRSIAAIVEERAARRSGAGG
jgi:CheY-like chemotaxis protein